MEQPTLKTYIHNIVYCGFTLNVYYKSYDPNKKEELRPVILRALVREVHGKQRYGSFTSEDLANELGEDPILKGNVIFKAHDFIINDLGHEPYY